MGTGSVDRGGGARFFPVSICVSALLFLFVFVFLVLVLVLCSVCVGLGFGPGPSLVFCLWSLVFSLHCLVLVLRCFYGACLCCGAFSMLRCFFHVAVLFPCCGAFSMLPYWLFPCCVAFSHVALHLSCCVAFIMLRFHFAVRAFPARSDRLSLFGLPGCVSLRTGCLLGLAESLWTGWVSLDGLGLSSDWLSLWTG